MATITLTVQDESLINKVSQACQMIKGVMSVKVSRKDPAPLDITKTAGFREALKDVEEGRVTEWNSVDEYFSRMGVGV